MFYLSMQNIEILWYTQSLLEPMNPIIINRNIEVLLAAVSSGIE